MSLGLLITKEQKRVSEFEAQYAMRPFRTTDNQAVTVSKAWEWGHSIGSPELIKEWPRQSSAKVQQGGMAVSGKMPSTAE